MMTRTKSEIKPAVENGQVKFSVKIDAEGDLVENKSTADIAEPEILEQVNREVAGEITRLVRRSLDKAQRRLGADIFGFGEKLHKAEPEYWKQVEGKWYDIYPAVDVNIQVKADIRRTGMISKPFKIK
jgi:spore germination protein KC